MPVVIGGTTYYAYDRKVIEARSGQNLANTPIVVRRISDGSVLTPLQLIDPYPAFTDFSSNEDGISPACFLPDLKVIFDIGLGPFSVSSDDVPDLAQSAATSAASAATSAASASAAQTAVDAFIAGGGGGGTGGTGGIKVVNYVSGAWPATRAAAGVATGDRAWFLGAARAVAPPSWIAVGDLVGISGSTP